jgi:hypothetical protein
MFNNYGIFSFGPFNDNSEAINKKLSDKDNPPSLEDLLTEEGIIEELQNKNEKLISFFNKEKIKQMLDYIIKEPKEEDQNKGHKFPFICSKLFNVEETKIMKYFFNTNKELFEENKKIEENCEKNGEKNVFFDDNQDEDKYEDVKDMEINIDDINKNKEEENNNDHCNYEDIKLENIEIKLNEDEDEVKLNENKNNQNNDNDDDMVIQKIEKKEENDNNKMDEEENLNNVNKNICLFKSPNQEEHNLINQRYEIPSIKKENKDNNKENSNKSKNIEKNEDEYSDDKIEILDYFFSFLIEDSELNYVLCGYFSSLMTNLLNINWIKIINYLFLKRKDILKRLVYHSYRKSIAETLCKIIKYEDKFNEEKNNNIIDEKEFSLIRLDIIKDIFDKIDINMDSEKLFSLTFIINDLSDNKNIFESILNNKNIIHSLITKQLKDINLLNCKEEKDKLYNKKNNFITILDIIINWLNNIKKNDFQIPMLLYEVNEDFVGDDFVQQKETEEPEVHHTLLSKALFEILPNLIENNFNKLEKKDNSHYISQSYNDYELEPLGLYRIKIVEMITSLISYCKNIANELDNLLINSNFFDNAINNIFEYEWNNLYQEAIFQFFNNLFNYDKEYPFHEISVDYIFSKFGILNKITTNLDKIKNNNENEGNSGNGFMAFLISLSYKINALIGGDSVNLNNNYSKEGVMTFMDRAENLNSKVLDMFCDTDNNKKKDGIKPVECMEKFCSEKWIDFFRDNISSKIKLYEEQLCQMKEDDDSLFDNANDNDETEDLLGKYKSRDEELFEDINKNEDNEDLVINDFNDNYEINKNDKEMAKFKDMEINLNEFNFIDENENKKEEVDINNNENHFDKKENVELIKIDKIYNSVNFWKNSLENESNSYINNIGQEALNDLLE